MHLDPLLGETGVVNISDIQMDSNRRTIDFIQKCPELARRDKNRCSELQFSQPILTSAFAAVGASCFMASTQR